MWRGKRLGWRRGFRAGGGGLAQAGGRHIEVTDKSLGSNLRRKKVTDVQHVTFPACD